jgi:hypothetical protein
MDKQRVAILIASAIGLASVFLPWMEHPLRGTVTGFHPRIPIGKIEIILFTIPIIYTLISDRTKQLSNKAMYVSAGSGAVAAVLGFMAINTYSREILINIGMGLYLLVLSAIAIPVLAFLLKKKST